MSDIKDTVKTFIDKKDIDKWTDIEGLKAYQHYADENLKKAINQQDDYIQELPVSAKEFVAKTLAEAFGIIFYQIIFRFSFKTE